jgi:hypothetical protein
VTGPLERARVCHVDGKDAQHPAVAELPCLGRCVRQRLCVDDLECEALELAATGLRVTGPLVSEVRVSMSQATS